MSEKAIAVGGVALVSLAAFTFSNSPESSASTDLKAPEPIVSVHKENDPWSGECRLPAPEKQHPEVTCALPASPISQVAPSDLSGPVEIFPAPIAIESKVVAEAIDGMRTFRLDRIAAANMVAKHLETLSVAELQKEHAAVDKAEKAERALAQGIPTRDTNFLRGVEEAMLRAFEARKVGSPIANEELASIITTAMSRS